MGKRMSVAARPCSSCPYRKDAPSGVWGEEEYAKLPAYDKDTCYQPLSPFMCHQQARDQPLDHLCAGWLHVHGEGLMALRLGVLTKEISSEVYGALRAGTDVPLFASGAEAAEHGREEIDDPGPEACEMIDKLQRIRGLP